MAPSIWSAGRYDAVGERIYPIAEQVLDAVERRRPVRGATVVDLACGTGSAALAAARRGAKATGLDITPELVSIAEQRPDAAAVTWHTGDAADTGLPPSSFDVAVSNMGVIFVDPDRQVTEVVRLLTPAGVFAFSAWVRAESNPFFDPVVAVLGPPATSGFSPDQWGDAETLGRRLGAHFDDLDIERGLHRWEFESLDAAMHFLQNESPVHVETFRRAQPAAREQLAAEFESAMRAHVGPSGAVAFTAPYVVVSASRNHRA